MVSPPPPFLRKGPRPSESGSLTVKKLEAEKEQQVLMRSVGISRATHRSPVLPYDHFCTFVFSQGKKNIPAEKKLHLGFIKKP